MKALQSTLLQNTLPIGNYNGVIQVVFLEKEKHWAVISTVNSEKDVVLYYDCLHINFIVNSASDCSFAEAYKISDCED